ncbi:Dynactin Arp1 p62 subunit Ro2 [Neofusicoccum parvum]|uniref:Dynactin subunit 4 n=1 Tax=Botryosphaeria parva (strain UCR-NP2) TaxID=1287680 RepID=R1EV41_BOTPV|nr:putative dynactin arp1 p62 subunit ro2 protein [Neofusicoccum parvum UCRNP2]GME53894.1 Dynactin Arp1 p62 subunit Ro2 [Neofusicoccum parvum]
MAQTFPYTFYSCPCVDTSTPSSRVRDKRSSQYSTIKADDEDRTFDPRNPRSNYSLYPLEHLLYCEDCHQIRCPRCVSEEVITWFCPSCLFEVPSSNIRSDGNRCMRSCYNCPICTAPMIVNSLDSENEKHVRLGEAGEAVQPPGPFYLACPYCQWSTLEIGVEFEKPNNISGQLARLENGGKTVPTLREREKARDKRKEAEENGKKPDEEEEEDFLDDGSPLDHDMRFSNLSAFYKSQLQTDSVGGPYGGGADYGYGNSSTLSRIMSMYSGGGGKKKKDKFTAMREAFGTDEGFQVHNSSSEDEIIKRMRSLAPLSFDYNKLQPFMANHFILTIRNPLFDPIHVTLATPAITPGRIASKVTVLCPEFEVGANTDVWDEALTGSGAAKRKSLAPSSIELGASNPATQAEAGKVWERGRNWTSVVLEVVPDKADPAELEGGLDEDEDVLELPMFVRIEYETDVTAEDSTTPTKLRTATPKNLASAYANFRSMRVTLHPASRAPASTVLPEAKKGAV